MPYDLSVHEVKGEVSQGLWFRGGNVDTCQSVSESGVAASQEEDGDIEEGESTDDCRQAIQDTLKSIRCQVPPKDIVQYVCSISHPLQTHTEQEERPFMTRGEAGCDRRLCAILNVQHTLSESLSGNFYRSPPKERLERGPQFWFERDAGDRKNLEGC